MASRLSELYHKPTIVLRFQMVLLLVSARSVTGFDIYKSNRIVSGFVRKLWRTYVCCWIDHEKDNVSILQNVLITMSAKILPKNKHNLK